MDITDISRTEHRLQSRLLDGFEALIDRAEREATLDIELARMLFDFFDRCVDGLHQDKEERVLFPMLLARAGRPGRTEVERLEAHHRRDRRLLAVLSTQVARASTTDTRLAFFVTQARVWLAFQRRHMLEEDAELLPLAARALTMLDDRAVRAGYRRIEHEYGVAFEPEARRVMAELRLRLGDLEPSDASRRLALHPAWAAERRMFP